MFVVGGCVASPDAFENIAMRGIRASIDEDVVLVPQTDVASMAEGYNAILDEARSVDDLEGVVLLHEDVELRAEDLLGRLRRALADPKVGLIGVIGARGVRTLEWWTAERIGRAAWNAGGGIRAENFSPARWPADVDCVDGMFMVLSPWVARTLRFDTRYEGFHAYDVDFAFTVRDAGKRVVVDAIDLHHHRDALSPFADRLGFLGNDIRWRAKWGFLPPSRVPLEFAALGARSKLASIRARFGVG